MTTETFNKLSKKEKVVLVCKDILKQIKESKYIIESGTYIRSDIDLDELEINITDDIQKNFKKLPVCKVCGIGASILSCTKLGNVLKFNDIDINNSSIHDLNNKNVKRLLKSVFTPIQLNMIESAFEGTEKSYSNFGKDILDSNLSKSQRDNCNNFNKTYLNNRERAITIFKNIIKNEGIFKP